MRDATKSIGLALLVLGVVGGAAGQVKAGQFLSHGEVIADTLYLGIPIGTGTPGAEMSLDGDHLDTGLLSSTAFGGVYGQAQATAGNSAAHLLGVYSDSNLSAYGMAAWRDVAYATTQTPPPVLRMTFGVEGSLMFNAAPGGSGQSSAMLGVTVSTNPSIFFSSFLGYVGPFANEGHGGLYTGMGGTFEALWGGDPSFVASGWDTLSASGGTLHVDIPYDPSLGGYGIGIALEAYTEGEFGASGTVDALHTLGLRAVTLTDGTPVDVTFDSGLVFGSDPATVPEPSTLISGAVAGLAGLGYAWRRCKAKLAA